MYEQFFEIFYNFRDWLIDTTFPIPIEFIKWEIIDFIRWLKSDKKAPPHIFGIWCFVGMEGGGKTMSLVHYLECMRQKYGDKIYISTNFAYKHEDFPLSHWKILKEDFDKSVIFAYDELQNEFSSRDYKDFPAELVFMLTQNRKKNGKQVVYTTQDYDAVDKKFRQRVRNVVTCRTILNRLTHCRYYTRIEYEHYMSITDLKRKMKVKKRSEWFVQSDKMRDLYDSYALIETAKAKEYMGMNET